MRWIGLLIVVVGVVWAWCQYEAVDDDYMPNWGAPERRRAQIRAEADQEFDLFH